MGTRNEASEYACTGFSLLLTVDVGLPLASGSCFCDLFVVEMNDYIKLWEK